MTKTIIAIVLAAIMVVGTLGFNSAVFAANPNANDASPANGGVTNGLPFTNLQEQIDAINDEIDALTADNDENIEALQDQIDAINDEIDALTTDVDANADAITTLEEDIAVLNGILGSDCGSNAIKAISSTGVVSCISINESEGIATMTRTSSQVQVSSFTGEATRTVSCLSGWTISGGGFNGVGGVPSLDHNGSFIRTSEPLGNGWTVTGNFIDIGNTHGAEHFSAVAQCIKVF